MEINCIFWCYPKIQRVVGYFWFLLELPVELSSNCCTWRFCDRTPLSGGEIKGCWWPSTIGDQKVNKLIRLVAVFSKLHVQVSLFVSCNLQRLRSFSSNMTCQKMPHPKNYCQMRMIFEGVNFWEVFFFQPFLGEFWGISSCYEPAFFEAHVGNSRGEEVVGRQWLVVGEPKKRPPPPPPPHRTLWEHKRKQHKCMGIVACHPKHDPIFDYVGSFREVLELFQKMQLHGDSVTEWLKGSQVTAAIFTKCHKERKRRFNVDSMLFHFWKVPLLSAMFLRDTIACHVGELGPIMRWELLV